MTHQKVGLAITATILLLALAGTSAVMLSLSPPLAHPVYGLTDSKEALELMLDPPRDVGLIAAVNTPLQLQWNRAFIVESVLFFSIAGFLTCHQKRHAWWFAAAATVTGVANLVENHCLLTLLMDANAPYARMLYLASRVKWGLLFGMCWYLGHRLVYRYHIVHRVFKAPIGEPVSLLGGLALSATGLSGGLGLLLGILFRDYSLVQSASSALAIGLSLLTAWFWVASGYTEGPLQAGEPPPPFIAWRWGFVLMGLSAWSGVVWMPSLERGFWLLIVAMAASFYSLPHLFQYGCGDDRADIGRLYACRYPLAAACLIFVLPPLLRMPLLESLFQNMLALSDPAALVALTVIIILTAWAAIVSYGIIEAYSDARLQGHRVPPFDLHVGPLGAAAVFVAGPLLFNLITLFSQREPFGNRTGSSDHLLASLACVAGIVLSTELMHLVLSSFGHEYNGRFVMNIPLPGMWEKPRQVVTKWLLLSNATSAGYIENGDLLPGHMVAIASFAMALLTYSLLFFNHPNDHMQPITPATPMERLLLWVVVLLTLAGLCLLLHRAKAGAPPPAGHDIAQASVGLALLGGSSYALYVALFGINSLLSYAKTPMALILWLPAFSVLLVRLKELFSVDGRPLSSKLGGAARFALVAFAVGFLVNSRWHSTGPFVVPTLLYLMLIFILFTWILSAMSFLLDAYRLPTVVVLGVLIALSGSLFNYQHECLLKPAAGDASTPREAMDARLALMPKAGEKYDVILVAINGGGILAGYWSANVLTGLEHFTPDFRSHVTCISGVSGGSMGAMFYLDRSPDTDATTLKAEVADSSLERVAWSMAYLDLPHRFFGSLANPVLGEAWDRGYELEHAWEGHRRNHIHSTLGSWAAQATSGAQPSVILNSTIVESGQPFLFSSVRGYNAADVPQTTNVLSQDNVFFERAIPNQQQRTFFDCFSKADLDTQTAARLSATFPFVSPMACLRMPPVHDSNVFTSIHFADGGIVENTGVPSAVQWFQSMGRDYVESRVRRVLLLRIINPVSEGPPTSSNVGWINATVGSGVAHELGQAWLESELPDVYAAQLNRWLDGNVQVYESSFVLPTNGPLSWEMSSAEQEDVARGWEYFNAIHSLVLAKPSLQANELVTEVLDDHKQQDYLRSQRQSIMEEGFSSEQVETVLKARIYKAVDAILNVQQFLSP